MNRLIFLFGFLLLAAVARSQNNVSGPDFNYSLSSDSVAWQDLNTQTILNTNNGAWNFFYRIPIGFSFHYLGANFDSLQIETNGYLFFGNNRNYAFAAFNGFGDRVDSAGNHAVLGYELSGSQGNHILKIQFKNIAQRNASRKYLSYQVWLFESGNKIEMRVGANNYSTLRISQLLTVDAYGLVSSTSVPVVDSVAVMIGALNMNMNTATRGFLLSGSFDHPQGQQVNDASPELPHLLLVPRQGYRYTFQPSN